MSDHKTPDLARIRDNQRRSRARRKEYLQELESKFRICERTGAEASSEIQSAARAVAEENKRLRLLLQQHGISDPELGNVHQSSSAASLDHALSVRKPCGSSTDRGASAPPIQSRTLQPRPEPEQQWEAYQTFTSASSSSPYHLEEQQHIPIQQDQQQSLPPHLHSSSTSCYDIASVIRTVRPYMGTELEAQLGCADGRECSIPNARAFDLLDQLSESHNTG